MDETNKKIDELVVIVKGNTEAIGELSVMVKNNATAIEDLATIVKSGFDHVSEEIASVRTELKNEITSEISSVRTEISELRSEMHDGFMKTNDKVDLLTVKLQEKKVITPADAKEVMAISPLSLS
jgi:uncharacterized protein YfbU (UPF0304 family)